MQEQIHDLSFVSQPLRDSATQEVEADLFCQEIRQEDAMPIKSFATFRQLCEHAFRRSLYDSASQ